MKQMWCPFNRDFIFIVHIMHLCASNFHLSAHLCLQHKLMFIFICTISATFLHTYQKLVLMGTVFHWTIQVF